MNTFKEKTIYSFLWSVSERFFVMGLNFIITLLLTRLVTPGEYGTFAILCIFLSFGDVLVDSGFSLALVRKNNCTESDYSTVFYSNIIIALILYSFFVFSAPSVSSFFKLPDITALVGFFSLAFIFSSLTVVQYAILSIKLDFKTQAKISCFSTTISGLLCLFLAYHGWGVWALAWMTVARSFLKCLFVWIVVKWYPRSKFSLYSFKQLFGFGSKILTAGLLDVIFNNIYIILIGKLFSPAQLGLYSRADQLAKFPSLTLSDVLVKVTFPALSAIREDGLKLQTNFRKMCDLSAFTIFPLMLGLSAISEPLVNFLFTNKWAASASYLQILCWGMMWHPVQVMNLNLLKVTGFSNIFLRVEIIKKIITLCIFSITFYFGLKSICYGYAASMILIMILSIYYLIKTLEIDILLFYKKIIIIYFNSIIMFFIIIGTKYFLNDMQPGHQLLILVPIGLVYYFSAFKTAHFSVYSDFKEIIIKKILNRS